LEVVRRCSRRGEGRKQDHERGDDNEEESANGKHEEEKGKARGVPEKLAGSVERPPDAAACRTMLALGVRARLREVVEGLAAWVARFG
jgi:hypothetical protein